MKILNRLGELINSNHLLLLFLVLVLGSFFRLYRIDNPVADWHSFRQADTASVARMYVQNGINLFDPRYHDISTIQSGFFNPNGYRLVEFPIYNALIAFFFKSFGILSLETWARILSILFANISAILIYWLGKRFADKNVGIFASFFFMFLPYNIYFTRVILPEPLGTALGLLGLVLFIKSVDESKPIYKYTSSLIFALAILVKPFTVFYFVPLAYFVFRDIKPNLKVKLLTVLKTYFVFALIVFVPFFIWRFMEAKHPEGIPFYKWMFNGDGIRFKPSFWRWIFGERLGYLILGTWGLIPFSYGLVKKGTNFFMNYFIFGMLLYVCIIATANVRHDYYQTFIIPAVTLVMAVGAVEMLRINWMSRILLAVSILVMSMVGLTRVREFYKIDHPEIINTGVAVDRLLPANSKIIAPYNGDTAFLYQTKRTGWPYVDRPIGEMVEEGAEYYVSVNFDDQTNEFINKFPTLIRTKEYIILKLK